jgi:hypothetical protein
MNTGRRKYEALDILALYDLENGAQIWNAFLTKAYRSGDINVLAKRLYGLQAGMADLERKKMATDKIRLQFVRWQKSLEDTIKKIVAERSGNPNFDPLLAKAGTEAYDEKKRIDREVDAAIRKASF